MLPPFLQAAEAVTSHHGSGHRRDPESRFARSAADESPSTCNEIKCWRVKGSRGEAPHQTERLLVNAKLIRMVLLEGLRNKKEQGGKKPRAGEFSTDEINRQKAAFKTSLI